MNARERFLALMRYDDVDRLPFWDLEGITEQAVRQWCLEGMPIGVNVDEHVGYDSRIQIPLVPTSCRMSVEAMSLSRADGIERGISCFGLITRLVRLLRSTSFTVMWPTSY